MPKKCHICSQEAEFKIKDTNDFYCKDCAIEHFGDLSYLKTIEEEAQLLKAAIKERLDNQEEDL